MKPMLWELMLIKAVAVSVANTMSVANTVYVINAILEYFMYNLHVGIADCHALGSFGSPSKVSHCQRSETA